LRSFRAVAARAKLRAELEALYRSRYERFLRVALAVVREEAAAHDAVQEGFARALKGLEGFDGEAPLEGWVWRIVLNAALAARRVQPLLSGEMDVAADQPSGDEFGIRAWISRLPERQRMAVFLRYYADLDYRSIAVALEIEVGTVSATLSAAHAALRRELKEVRQ
jgi:RNA polymerase sigma factor (sigma-70 family)